MSYEHMTPEIAGHSLVVGGSGMLKGVSVWLAAKGYVTSVIGRNANRLNSLVHENSFIIPLSVDYNNLTHLENTIRSTVKLHGVFNIVVAWIHNNQEKVIDVIRHEIECISDKQWEFYHVLGSTKNLKEIKKGVSSTKSCAYYQIQLGFKTENHSSRWLTNDEIANGVIESIQNKKNVLIGQVEPWELRP